MSEQEFRDKTAVAGIGYSRSLEFPGAFSRRSGVSVLTLAVRAAKEAARDAGINPADIDGAVMYHQNDSVLPGDLLQALGCRNVTHATTLQGGGQYSGYSIVLGAQAVYHGISKYTLVYRAMNGRTGVRVGRLRIGAGLATGRVGGPEQFTQIYGLAGAVAIFAFQARRYMDQYGVTSLDFANFAVNSRNNAIKNPRAIMRSPLTIEEHQSSAMIVDPYHIFDCCQETDVAVAMILTTAERARSLRKRPVLISSGHGGGPLTIPRLLAGAGIAAKDIDFAELYDNFTDSPLRMIEDMGWCGRGEAKEFIKGGRIALDGELPLQTHGGLINEGYAHGLNNGTEAVQQLRGEAEDLCPGWSQGEHTYERRVCRQVRDPEIALHMATSGNSAVILKRG